MAVLHQGLRHNVRRVQGAQLRPPGGGAQGARLQPPGGGGRQTRLPRAWNL